MKNIVIALIVLIAAALIYQQVSQEPAKEVRDIEPVAQDKAADTQTVEESNPLISKAAADARVFIIEPVDGATLQSPVKVVFGIENMAVAPAGQNVANSGHHHLLIDLDELPPLDTPLPANDNVIHFGKGQTETIIELEPGNHSLQLLLGNYLHIPHEQAVLSDKISINITE